MFNHHVTWLLVLINGSRKVKHRPVINLQSDASERAVVIELIGHLLEHEQEAEAGRR